MSTRGSSASHAVFGLEAPLALSAHAAAAIGEGRAERGGAEEGVFEGATGEGCREECHRQARGNEAGAQEEALNWGGGQQAGQGASGAGGALADHQSWSRRWTRFPGVMKVDCCVCVCVILVRHMVRHM